MNQLWYLLLYQPLINGLILLYKLFGNLGWALIGFTIVVRLLLVPLTLPSLKAAKKMQELAPQIEKLKKKYRDDKQKFSQAQLELYRRSGANPAAGCLPQIIQFIVLIAFYQGFSQVLQHNGGMIIKLNQVLYSALRFPAETVINNRFFYLNLNQPDVFKIPNLNLPLPGPFLVLAALVQFLSSKMMQPSVAVSQAQAQETPEKADDMATAVQSQMLYLFPLMTILIGFSFPSGLTLYWLVFSIFSAVQQYFISGWGGLDPWLKKIKR